ncbi:MAG: DUF2493 domain-containing protein [Promethearchaeota archaeon]|jgi:hypothetical protein
MKLAVVGSRSFTNYDFLKKMLAFHECTQIISGGARGADRLAKQYAAECGIPIKEFLPDWDTHGKAAGYIRNKQIVEACDELVAFWDEESRGTQHSINLANEASKPVYKYWPPPEDITEGIGI